MCEDDTYEQIHQEFTRMIAKQTRARRHRQAFELAAVFLGIILLVALCFALAGCQNLSPQEKAYDAHKAYTLALTGTGELVDAHKLSTAQERQALDLISAADAALALVDASVAQGGNGIDAALQALYDTLGRMATLKASATTQPTTTQPSHR